VRIALQSMAIGLGVALLSLRPAGRRGR
jgi:hypothetical protein